VVTILTINATQAIPAFSRKYSTSCVTCHSVFPKLNPFGEAFRINGYQFPKGNDEDEKIKEGVVLLGSEAYKRVWPNAVWPNNMPGSAPISFRARSAYEVTTVNNSTTGEFSKPALQILGGGTMGKDISLFVGAHLFEDGKTGSIDRLFVKFNNLLDKYIPENLLYLQIGQFIPELVPFATNHRGLTNTAYAFNTYDPIMGSRFITGHTHTGKGFGIENFQLGIEASGIVKSRLRYVVGIVNGSGTEEDVNAQKDFYGRLSYKFGGIGYDGTSKEGAQTDSEKSFAIGGFGYNGISTDSLKNNFTFYRAGVDFNIYLNNSNIIGGYILGSNKTGSDEKYGLYFVEIDHGFYPWLHGILRYEYASPKNKNSISQIIPHISALIVSNVKIKIESRLNPEDLKFTNIYAGFDFAF